MNLFPPLQPLKDFVGEVTVPLLSKKAGNILPDFDPYFYSNLHYGILKISIVQISELTLFIEILTLNVFTLLVSIMY